MIKLVEARQQSEYLAAIALFKEYAEGLGIDLSFQNFDAELNGLRLMYGPPVGELWLVQSQSAWIGCCALRRLDDETCELKRMYVKPANRGLKIGALMMQTAIDKALALGYKKMRLDSLKRLTPALNLYQKAGFQPIAPYNYNPEDDVVYYELDLRK